MGGNRRSREPSKALIGQKRSCNQDAVGQIVNRIANQNQGAARAGFTSIMAVIMSVAIGFVMVAVPKDR